MLGGTFIALKASIRKKNRKLSSKSHLNKLEKKSKLNPKEMEERKFLKIGAEISVFSVKLKTRD